MTKNHYPYIIAAVLTIVLAGCKLNQPVTTWQAQKLPDRYPVELSLSNTALLNRNQFFTDAVLLNLIDSAITNNYDSRIALQRIEQARASVLFSKGLLLPTVNVGGVAAVRRYGLYTMDGAGNATTDIEPGKIVPVNLPDYLIGLQSSWEVDITGKLRNRKKAAAARLLASTEGHQWLIANLVEQVATAYYELLSLDKELDIVRSTIKLQENALEVVLIQKENAAANELVVDQFKAQLLDTKSMEFEVQQAIVDTETRINTLLGRLPQTIERNTETFDKNISGLATSGVPSDLLRNRPDIRQAELEVLASKADLAAARAAFFPSLNITASTGFQAYTNKLLFNSPESFAFTLVGGLSAPLLNRSAIKASFNAANAYQVETLYNYNKTVLRGYAEVYTELTQFENVSRSLDLKLQEAEALIRAIETANELYRTGRANYLEVLMIQRNALEARLDLVYTKKLQFINSIQLYKSLGGG
jgi:multidrug efflux system outer membrane protein